MTVETSRGPDRDPARNTRFRRGVTAVTALWLLAVVAGALVGGGGSGGAESPGQAHVTSGQMSLAYQSPWSRTTTRQPVPGLHLDEPLTLRSTNDGLELVAGTQQVSDPRLLPAAFRRAIERPPDQVRVQMRSAQGFRYARLQQKDTDVEFSLTVIPMHAAAAYIVCRRLSQSIDASDQAACDAIGQTTQLKSGARPLAPTASYARALQPAIRSLETVRRDELHRLGEASSISEQVAVLNDLRDKCRARALAFRRVASGPQEQALQMRLARAVDQLCAAFSTMASAAAHDDRSRYAQAAKRSSTRARSVAAAVRAFRAAGYRLR